MINVKTAILGILAVCVSVTSWAQVKSAKLDRKSEKRERINQMLRLEEEGEPGYAKHGIFHFKFNTDGYGLGYELGKTQSIFKTNIYQIEFNEKKHRKEEKQSRGSGNFVFGNPFVFGKQIYFYQLKLGVGQQRMIGGKGNKNGVGVYGIFAGGLSAGLERPYYLDVQDPPNSGKVRSIAYSKADSLLFMGPEILGGSGFSKGWSEIKIVPGIHAKTALRFDWGRFNNTISAVEAGFNFEYYTKKIDQMVGVTPSAFFINGYLAVLFGSRK